MNDLDNLRKLGGLYIKFCGIIGESNSDFTTIPSTNVTKGNMYLIGDDGWYKTLSRDKESSNTFTKDVLFHAGDILIALKSSTFLVYEKDNWLHLNYNKEKEDKEKIKSFVSYPFIDFVNEDDATTVHEKILEAVSSVSSILNVYEKDEIINEEWNNAFLLCKFNSDTINFLTKRLKLLSSAECVYFCKGWNKDEICMYEYLIAKKLNKKIIVYPEV